MLEVKKVWLKIWCAIWKLTKKLQSTKQSTKANTTISVLQDAKNPSKQTHQKYIGGNSSGHKLQLRSRSLLNQYVNSWEEGVLLALNYFQLRPIETCNFSFWFFREKLQLTIMINGKSEVSRQALLYNQAIRETICHFTIFCQKQ